MIIGVPKEILPQEDRVGLVPSGARVLVQAGHVVLVEQGAGSGSGLHDDEYVRAGATLVRTPEDVYAQAQMIWKVGRPEPQEVELLRPDQVLFAFLHLAADPGLAQALSHRGVVPFACESFQLPGGERPIQRPMSEVAGRLAVQAGASCMERPRGGRGILLGGVPGVRPGRVAVLGAGVVGTHAAMAALGLGADVVALDVDLQRLSHVHERFRSQVKTLYATPGNLEESLIWADLVIGAVHVRGSRTPVLVSRDQLGVMQPGAVVVDVSVSDGGCFQTTRPTCHGEPTYVVDGVVHHSVPNMPGAVARTSTFALSHVSLLFGKKIGDLGWRRALEEDPVIRSGYAGSP